MTRATDTKAKPKTNGASPAPGRKTAAAAALALIGGVVVTAACRGGAQRGDVAEPSAILVAPAEAGPTIVGAPEPAPAPEAVLPIELAVDAQRLCLRLEGRVHCTTSLAADVALTAAPALEGIEDAVSLGLGETFGCAATRAGQVLCFGDNTFGQLGAQLRADRSERPVVVSGVAGARRVFTSDRQACALLRNDTVRCWGANDSGQTGGSTYYHLEARELVAAETVEGVVDVASVAVGGSSTCASTHARKVMCWGRALFDGDAMMHGAHNVRPVLVPELAGLEDITASGGAFCGIAGGDVKCWGELYSLLDNETARSSKLASMGVTGARKVRVSQTHGCALLTDGSITCWGMGSYGALGRGETTGYAALAPEPVRGVASAVDIAVGGSTSCAVTAAREIYCWGSWPHANGSARKETLPVKMRLD